MASFDEGDNGAVLPPLAHQSNGRVPASWQIRIAGTLAIMIGALALVGWITGPAWLTSWGSGFATMKPITAILVMALGLSLVREVDDRGRRLLAQGVIAISVFSLMQDLLGRDLGLERLLAPRSASPVPGTVGWRMASATAVGLLAAALGILLAGTRKTAAAGLAAAAGVVALFVLLSFAMGTETLDRLTPFSSVSLPTAFALIALGTGLLTSNGPRLYPTQPWPLQRLLLLLSGAIVGPLLLFGIYAGGRIAQSQLQQSRAELVASARTLSAAVDREIAGEIETLLALAASPSLREGDIAAFYRQAQASLEYRHRGAILLIAPDGQMLMTTRMPYGSALPTAMQADLAREVAAVGQPRVSGLFTGRIAQAFVFNILVPVRIDGEVRYVIARSPGVESLAYVVRQSELPDGWLSGVSDGNNRIIARSHDQATFVGRELSQASRQATSRSGLTETNDLAGRRSLQAFVWSDLTGWRAAVWAPKALIEAPVQALWRTTAIIGLMAVALVLGLGLWLSRVIEQSMAVTITAARAMGEGQPIQVPSTAVVEANALGLALRDAAAARARADEARTRAEAAVRASEARYRAVFNQQFQFVAILSPDGVLLEINDLSIAATGVPRECVIGSKFWETPWFSPLPDMQRAWPERLMAAAEANGPVLSIDRFATMDGNVRLAECAIVTARDHAGQVEFFIVQASDITERKQSEEALRDSESRLAAILDALPIGVALVDNKGRTLVGNSVYASYVPAVVPSRDEQRHGLWKGYSNGQRIDRSDYPAARALRGERVWPGQEFLFQGREAGPVWTRIAALPFRASDGEIIGATVVIDDIDKEKRTLDALRESESRLNLAQTAAAIGIWDWDLVTGKTGFNPVYYRLLGLADGTTHGYEDFLACVHPSDRARVAAAMETAIGGGEPYDIEYRIARASDGAERWMAARGEVLRGSDGRPFRAMGIVHDVTARKLAELSVRESEERLRQASDAAGFGVHDFDTGRQVGIWSDGLRRIFGLDVKDEHERPIVSTLEFTHPDDRERVRSEMEEIQRRPGPYEIETRIVRADGKIRWILDRGEAIGPIDPASGLVTRVMGTLIDITERKLAEQELMVAAERAEVAQQAAGATLYEYFPDSDCVVRNGSMTPVLGYGIDEIPATGRGWFDLIHADDIEHLQEVALASIATGKSFALEYRVRHKRGHYIWVSDSARVTRGEHGHPARVVGMVIDITERKAREEQIFLLMKEVNHRAKNMLGLVQVIARQTAAGSPKDFARRFAERVQALSANQDLLISNEWTGVEITSLVIAQLAHFADLVGKRIRLDGPSLTFTPAAAQAFGLALHELATNAGKYGALSNDRGCVDIAWRQEADTLIFRWAERDGPEVRRPAQTGFGSTVLNTLTKMSVYGEVETRYEPTGLIWLLSCPLDKAVDGGGNYEHGER